MKLTNLLTPQQRRDYFTKKLKISLTNIAKTFVDVEKDVHCENMIGAISLPIGVAGPLLIRNQRIKKQEYYVPLATTEGALVASVNRGCRAISLSGKAIIYAERIGTTRGPVFYTGGLFKTKQLSRWLEDHMDELKIICETTSAHLKLQKYDIKSLADYVFVRFYFDTGEAMGMNMVTIAVDKLVKLIEKKTRISCLSVAGNYDTDKKPSWLNFIGGRGVQAWGEIILKASVVKKVLKTSPKKFYEIWLAKNMIGSAMSGSLGFNAHFANIIAAFFAATGQDLAHIVEGSCGMTTAKLLTTGDLYFSVYLPSLMVGVVGGGTHLKTQQEALSIIGVKKVEDLTVVLTGAVLAGEISLLSSLAEGSLARVHKALGR